MFFVSDSCKIISISIKLNWLLTQNKKEANIMKKFFLWAGAISLIAGSIYYAWLIRVEQQVQDNYQVAVEKQVKHPKIITIKNNFGLEHLVSLGNKKSGKATFMNRLKGYRNSSTPIVMIFPVDDLSI